MILFLFAAFYEAKINADVNVDVGIVVVFGFVAIAIVKTRRFACRIDLDIYKYLYCVYA